jgi:hypothetical protein
VAFIRVGFFEEFKGANTLLLDVDREVLNALIAWLQTATSSDRRTPISSCPSCIVQAGVAVDLLRAVNDTGLVRAAGTEFVWQRSEEGWAEVIDKLAAMDIGACHQYLDGPRGDLQIMASIGEYGDAWWHRYGS